jgi:hypothetical protein
MTTASHPDCGKYFKNFTLRTVATFTRGGKKEVIQSTFFMAM